VCETLLIPSYGLTNTVQDVCLLDTVIPVGVVK
jgi:hypothetical protein